MMRFNKILLNFSGNKITAILLCVLVVAINLLFVVTTVIEQELDAGLLTLVGELISLGKPLNMCYEFAHS